MHNPIDLRSDTVTRPTPAMRRAMADAEVGDDVYEDDPTVNRLQERSAQLLGMEAGLFVPSGTMANAVAIKTHTQPGDEILLDGDAHSMYYELGLPGAIAGVVTRQFRSTVGIPDVDHIRASIHTESLHTPATTLVVLENTHNRMGGTIIPIDIHKAIRDATARPISIHIDGARLFNAVVASGVPAAEYAKHADSVTFCFSKGLGCPIGSVLCGSEQFIRRARRVRKMLGGGMRQVGILAAAGLYALENNIARLQVDHKNARLLASRLVDAPGLTLDTNEPPTNMVYINTARPAVDVQSELKEEHSVLCGTFGPNRIRFVTHMDVNSEQIEVAAGAIRSVCS
jgi:threonine aldolase